MDPLSVFHPIVREWFERTFRAPTEAQVQGWPAIAGGSHTLISAPTGSGKTLAAFLICIDRLLQAAIRGDLPDVSRVVYVSPLKALSNDVHRNLSVPLREITDLAWSKGIMVPEIRVAVRTGDTPANERQATARRPPHIWITTPESLYILLTSQSGRRGLSGAETLILDEIHAVADDKRGSHLALSVERLCALVARPVTRIGLSATQRPIEEMARFLVGAAHVDGAGKPHCTIIDTGQRKVDLQIEMPGDELGPIASHELWDETIARVATLAQEHRTTLVFVNTRRLVERVAHILSQKIGEENVVAHHGSLSRKTRLKAEERLKRAEVKVCVATASLELGIDIGAVELVCQIGSPRSIGVLLQRVGRSGHWLGGTPKGRLFPLTRDELIECAALLYGVRRGDLDRLSIPGWPLDILSQQVVAMCSAQEWSVDELFQVVRKAHPYRELPREFFDSVIRVLSEGVSPRLGYRSGFLHYDRVHGVLRGRRGARLAAITGGGAIPDNADYQVVAEPDGTYVGSVNEDFAVESLAGDVFLLGNTSWRIRRIEKGTVRVEDARDQAPNIPFWLGEAPSRTRELSELVSEVRSGIDERLGDRGECLRWLAGDIGLSPAAAEQAFEYISEGKRVLGSVPTAKRIVAERFFDESGGMQLIIHAPLGGRINRAWGLALRKRFCRSFDFELQASGTEDGINLSLGPQHSFPLEDIFQFLRSHKVEDALTQAVLASPIFTTRWRWTITRSLALLRFRGGKRVPAPIQRIRSDDMLAAVFPAQVQCQDNKTTLDVSIPDHPLVFETLRDCLNEALDLEGLRGVLEALERGEIQFLAKDTPMPSAFSHQILNAMPYAFLDDAPLEERRARAVILRRALPESASDLGRLSPDAIRSAAEDAWPVVRDPNELHDMLLGLVLFPEDLVGTDDGGRGEAPLFTKDSPVPRAPAAAAGHLPADAPSWFESLEKSGMAFRVQSGTRRYWAATERRELIERLFGREDVQAADTPGETPLQVLVRGWADVSGPFTAGSLTSVLGMGETDIRAALVYLEGQGQVLRGHFTDARGEEEFCDRRILARIHRATIAHLRREIEPVSASVFLRFLSEWQHVAANSQLAGDHGVLEVVEQLQGYETAAVAWEGEILRCRVKDYEPGLLDSLCLAGDVVWGRWMRRATQAEVPSRRPGLTRNAVLGLGMREDMHWLLDAAPPDEQSLSISARTVLDFLRKRGASFFPEISAGTHRLSSEVEDALWQLVAAGLVTADSFAALRSMVSGEARRQESSPRHRRQPRRTREGRWSLLEPLGTVPQNLTELRARQYLRRYGVFFRELAAREPSAPPWRELLSVLRRLEARGEIRGGRFIDGLNGEQFALPDAVENLRGLRRKEPQGSFLRISACDPLNLVGILTPGARVAAIPGNRIVFRDGVPVAAVEGGETRLIACVAEQDRSILERLLDERPASAFDPERFTVNPHARRRT
ncbi:MAG TPA: DEAD/DEAH box helicase [Acidobacteriota bacterium]|nr:DEAD/DEAH box helicase [Acidobacteriota bacterium]